MADTGPEREYDVIVGGGGINGLTAACYLQKSGLRVACFERKLEAGLDVLRRRGIEFDWSIA